MRSEISAREAELETLDAEGEAGDAIAAAAAKKKEEAAAAEKEEEERQKKEDETLKVKIFQDYFFSPMQCLYLYLCQIR